MPKQIENININEPIYKDGAGDLKLGLNIFFLRKLYLKSFKKDYSISLENKTDWWTEFNDPYMHEMIFYYKDILEIYCNIFMGKISRIKFKEGYKGKLWGNISIGDKVKELFKFNEVNNAEFVELCDGNLFFDYHNNSFTLTVKIADDLDYVETDDELMNYDIQEFFIHYDDLSLYLGSLDFPENWKNSSPYKIGLE